MTEYLDELATPDLWEQINQETPIVSEWMFEGQDTSEFLNEEKAQLRLSLNEFRLLIKENFDPTADQMNIVDERLNYLSDALDRLNKFDWKSVLLSSAVSIVTALSLDTARGKLLFDFLKQAFMHVVFLPQ